MREENTELQRKLDEANSAVRRLEKERDSLERYNGNLRRRYRKVCEKREASTPDPAPVVEERVVVHEDCTTIDALRAKCEDLKERLWEYQKREGETMGRLERLKDFEVRERDWRRTYHGLILRAKNRRPVPDLDITIIDSKAYFQNRLDKETFEERHHLHGPYLVKELPYGR